MPEVYHKIFKEGVAIERTIGHIAGDRSGPCLVFIAGIHGNEPSGVFALQQVFEKIKQLETPIGGNLYGLAGNLPALEQNKRYQTTDLNRLWTKDRVSALEAGNFQPTNEDERQQLQLHEAIQKIIKKEKGPFYFFDLHTTSGETLPFITVNDSLLNRKFTRLYPVPSILGIEEYLDGPLLSYLNALGYVSFGFESGQHEALEAIENHEVFIWLSLVFTGVLDSKEVPVAAYRHRWKNKLSKPSSFFEIYYRHEIQPKETFQMLPGFKNFQKISKGQALAESNGKLIAAQEDTQVFMPLYQSQGSDGYYLIRPIPRFFLGLSRFLRKINFDRIFPLLPGVQWSSERKDTMLVNLKIARYIARPLFHLFGYRTRYAGHKHLYVQSREHASRWREYKGESWYG